MTTEKTQNFNENMLDSMLALACKKALDDEISKLPADKDITHTFSPEFERRMKSLIDKETRKARILKWRRAASRVAAIAVVAMAVGFASLMSVSALRTYVLNTVREFGEGYLGFQFVEEEPAPEYQEPSYIPEGFAEERRDSYGDSLYIAYTNEDKEIISIHITYKQRGSSLSIDNEDMLSHTVIENDTIINVLDGTSAGKNISIYWEDSRYFYEITAEYDMEELLKIAKSMIN